MLNSSLEPLLTCSGINQDRIKASSLKGRERETRRGRKEGKGLQEFIMPKKNEGELSHFTLFFPIIFKVLYVG